MGNSRASSVSLFCVAAALGALLGFMAGARNMRADTSLSLLLFSAVALLTFTMFRSLKKLHNAEMEQIRADQQARDLQCHLRRILDVAPIILWSTDENGIFKTQEGSGLRLLNLKPGQLVGTSIFSLEPGPSPWKDAVKAAQAGNETSFTCGFGGRHLKTILWPVKGKGGKASELSGITFEVTARAATVTERQKEGELARARNAAEASVRAKSLFLTNMSHEVRTPINGIMGMSWMLLETDLTEDQRDYALRIKNSTDSLARIVDNILDFSKLETGNLKWKKVPFSLEECMKKSITCLDFSAQKRGVTLSLKIADGLSEFYLGDSERVQQILANLVDNALKFTQRGCVTISVSNAEGKAGLRFEVCDTGVGVPSEVREKIFQAFQQADSSPTREYGGAGLGLSISKRLVELMGGEIGFHSTPGKGSIFWFSLPFLAASAEPLHLSSGLEPRGSPEQRLSLRLLLVEDNETNKLVLEKMLSHLGHTFCSTANGKLALDLLLSGEKFDLILTDAHMPVMDGMEFAKQLRSLKDRPFSSLPIIGISADAVSGSREKYLASGMSDYVPKPVTLAALKRVIAENAGARRGT